MTQEKIFYIQKTKITNVKDLKTKLKTFTPSNRIEEELINDIINNTSSYTDNDLKGILDETTTFYFWNDLTKKRS